MADQEIPFEATYERAKQSIINYVGSVAHEYDIPVTLINNLVYEIALESKISSASMILAGCDISYPDRTNAESNDSSETNGQTYGPMPAAEAIEEFKKQGMPVVDISDSTTIAEAS